MVKVNGRTGRLVAVLVLTTTYFFVEISVGYVTNSVALIADSFHMLSDVLALIIGLVAVRYARRPSSEHFTFGYKRSEVLGGLINGVFLLALCFSIAIEALQRFISPEPINNPELLLIVGSVGLGINIIGMIIMCKYSDMHLHSHGHDHGGHEEAPNSSGQHGHTEKAGHNMKAVFLHVLGDALGSIGVIISATIVWLVEDEWTKYIDPFISVFIVAILLFGTIPMVRQIIRILLDTAPKNLKVDDLKQKILEIEGVQKIHELHIWELQHDLIMASMHVRVNSTRIYKSVGSKIKELLHQSNIHSTTIQPEFDDDAEDEVQQPKHDCTDCAFLCLTSEKCEAKRCCEKQNATYEANIVAGVANVVAVIDEPNSQPRDA